MHFFRLESFFFGSPCSDYYLIDDSDFNMFSNKDSIDHLYTISTLFKFLDIEGPNNFDASWLVPVFFRIFLVYFIILGAFFVFFYAFS